MPSQKWCLLGFHPGEMGSFEGITEGCAISKTGPLGTQLGVVLGLPALGPFNGNLGGLVSQ